LGRVRVVVDPQVRTYATPVVALPGGDDEEGCALPAAGVATRHVAGEQRRDQSALERLPGAVEPGPLHVGDDLLADEDVALDGVAAADVGATAAAGPRQAVAAGVGGLAVDADHAELAVLTPGVGGG